MILRDNGSWFRFKNVTTPRRDISFVKWLRKWNATRIRNVIGTGGFFFWVLVRTRDGSEERKGKFEFSFYQIYSHY